MKKYFLAFLISIFFCLNGISLTANKADKKSFTVNVISHSLTSTNLAEIKIGDKVNVEIDLIARYVLRGK